MTFDQWWATLETREQHRADKALTEEAFAAGAASRDAEMQKCMSEISKLKDALGYDWDKYKASQEALREHMQIVAQKDAEIAELSADAMRYGWLKDKYFGADFNWNDEGVSCILFKIPDDIAIGANLCKSIDAAIAKGEKHAQ